MNNVTERVLRQQQGTARTFVKVEVSQRVRFIIWSQAWDHILNRAINHIVAQASEY